MLLDEEEFELFKRYEKGELVRPEDEDSINDLASIGFFRIGVSTTEGEARDTAVLTPLARNIYKREKIFRNPVKRFFYSLANI